MIKEFKKFILRGSIVDMAVGIVIGSSFTAIAQSLVNNIIMPFVGVLTAGVDFANIKIDLSNLAKFLGNKDIPAEGIYISIGMFINSIVQFLILACTVFLLIRFINKSKERVEKLKKAEEEEEEEIKEEEPIKKTDDILLLEEIRDLLKKKK